MNQLKEHGKEFSIYLFKLKLFIILNEKNMLLDKEESIFKLDMWTMVKQLKLLPIRLDKLEEPPLHMLLELTMFQEVVELGKLPPPMWISPPLPPPIKVDMFNLLPPPPIRAPMFLLVLPPPTLPVAMVSSKAPPTSLEEVASNKAPPMFLEGVEPNKVWLMFQVVAVCSKVPPTFLEAVESNKVLPPTLTKPPQTTEPIDHFVAYIPFIYNYTYHYYQSNISSYTSHYLMRKCPFLLPQKCFAVSELCS